MQNVTSRIGVVGELFRFLWARKLWWLIPMVILLIVISVLVVAGSMNLLQPFIYSLF